MSFLLDRQKLSRLAGFMFGGKRDLYKVFGYAQNITYEQILGKYQRQDITSRIIDAPADAIWTDPPKIEIEGLNAFENEWRKLVTNHNIWQILSRVDKLAGMADYSVLFLGFNTSNKLIEPAVSADQLLHIQPYAYNTLQISNLVGDPYDPRFLLPEIYELSPSKDLDSIKLRKLPVTFRAHASRILHVVENPLTNPVYGNPRGARVFNLLDDVLKVAGGTAETFWLTANRGLHVDVDKDMDLSEDDEKDITDEVEEYTHQLRRLIRTRGVKVNVLGSEVPNPKEVFSMLISLISGATGIPKRILLGSEAGQLASEQDRSNWADRIDERRSNFAEPLIRQLILQLSQAGLFGGAIQPEQIKITWNDSFKLSPLEVASAAGQLGRANYNMAQATSLGNSPLTNDEMRTVLGLI